MVEALLTLDGNILLFIQDYLRIESLDPYVIGLTKLGNLGFIWIIFSLFFCLFRKTRWAGIAGLMALGFSLMINNVVLKNLVARTRPYEVIDGLTLLVQKATDYSFPSGHTGSSFAVATAFYCMWKGHRLRWVPYILAILIGLSRLYIGIHYPSDVLAGMLIGIVCGIAASLITRFARHLSRK